MSGKKVAVTLVALKLFLIGCMTATPAVASDMTDSLLIGAYVTAGVTAIMLVAILLANREDPDLMPFAPARARDGAEAPGQLRLAPRCQPRDGNLTLACW